LFRLLKYSLVLQADVLLSVKRLFRLINTIIQEEAIEIIEMPDWNTFFQNSFVKINIPVFPYPNGEISRVAFLFSTGIKPPGEEIRVRVRIYPVAPGRCAQLGKPLYSHPHGSPF